MEGQLRVHPTIERVNLYIIAEAHVGTNCAQLEGIGALASLFVPFLIAA